MTSPALGDNCCSSLFCSIRQKREEHIAGQPCGRAGGLRACCPPKPYQVPGYCDRWVVLDTPYSKDQGCCLPGAARWKPGWKFTQQGKVLPIQLQGAPLTSCFISCNSVCKKATARQVRAVPVRGAPAQRPPGLSQTTPSVLGARKKLSWALH